MTRSRDVPHTLVRCPHCTRTIAVARSDREVAAGRVTELAWLAEHTRARTSTTMLAGPVSVFDLEHVRCTRPRCENAGSAPAELVRVPREPYIIRGRPGPPVLPP
jgi:hypothetical protein